MADLPEPYVVPEDSTVPGIRRRLRMAILRTRYLAGALINATPDPAEAEDLVRFHVDLGEQQHRLRTREQREK